MAQTQSREFGKYELLEKLATGGMAEIYRARYHAMPGVTKPLVIKKILPAYADNQAFVSMFVNEAKIAVGLSHGNIAQVFDFGEIDGEYFLAMEFVHGQPLSKVLKRCRSQGIPSLPIPFAILIAAEMCKGLHYAHTRLDEKKKPLNIIHRDVSPQNVIVSYEGQVKVVDFGIAKARTAGRTETEAGAVKGKYLYFSPEQARGKELDARTDVFATGVVLYEMLCGRLPFEGKMITVLGNIVKGIFPQPSQLNPDVPPELEEIVLTAMANDKDQRYPNAQVFGETLTSYLNRSAPQFSASSLHGLMEYLFEQELTGEGLPVRVSREILEQVPFWRRSLPTGVKPSKPPPPQGERTSAERRRPSSTSKPPASAPGRTRSTSSKSQSQSQIPSQIRQPPRWAYVSVPIAAMLVALAGVFVWDRTNRPAYPLDISSDPAPASIFVDGQSQLQTTPTRLLLSPDKEHDLELRKPGMKPWHGHVKGPMAQGLNVVLEPLSREAVAQDPVVAQKPPVQTAPTSSAPSEMLLPTEASYPVSAITLAAKQHILNIPQSHAARIKLDARKTYRLSAEGRISLGGVGDQMILSQAMYFVEGTSELKDSERYGMIGSHPITLRHARALYAFILDDRPDDNSGALLLHLDTKGQPSTPLLVDGRANALPLTADHTFALLNLSALDRYEVRILPGTPNAQAHGGGELGRVGYVQNSGWASVLGQVQGKKTVDATQRILEVGKRYEMTNVSWMRFFFLGDAPDQNSGNVRIEVVPLAGHGGSLNLDRILKH